MRRSNSGFSLIELLAVIAIVGVIAGFAYPAYKEYVIKTKVNKMYTYGKGLQAIVADAYLDSGAPDFSAINLDTNPKEPTASAVISGGQITLTGTTDIKGVILLLTPSYSDVTGRINWQCTTTDNGGSNGYIPRDCL